MTANPRPATTVLLLRPDPDGFRVFMVQRNRAVGFMPNAWVFPGGRVDEADRLAGHPRVRGGGVAMRQLGLPEPDAVASLVAGVRETFEEAGVWLGDGELPAEARGPLASGYARLAELLDRHDVIADLDRLRAWSWWVTPEAEPKRFDTRFLVARADAGDASHDEGETVASRWVTPREALDHAERAAMPMAPPTWWTLRELSAYDSADAVLAAAEQREQRPIQPILNMDGAAVELWLPGHPKHPAPAIPGLPTSVAFVQGRWWASSGA